ncbi:hypothetical protein IEE91_07305 [Kocuria sp. cx-455]|nr:hypothetical protein [Kocuria sp. cx-455]
MSPHEASPKPDTNSTDHPEVPQCSRRGCGRNAAWQLLWNNPKVHTPDRRKVWLACDEHRDYLGEFLNQRGFLKAVELFNGPEGEA